MPTELIRRRDVEKLTSISRAQIYRLMARDDFPRPLRVGRRAVAWRREDVEVWIKSRPIAGGWASE